MSERADLPACLRTLRGYPDNVVGKMAIAAADLIEAQAAQLAERDAEIERLKRMRSMVEREREAGLEALLQQARERLLDNVASLTVMRDKLFGIGLSDPILEHALDATRETLAAIQPGDSHE